MKCFTRICAAALVIAIAPAAWAAGNKALSEAQQQYRQGRPPGLSGQPQQARTPCLKEAGAAYNEARKGALNNSGSSYSQNAIERCKAQPATDQEACVQRVMGAGSTSGSVKGGGLIRQTETKVQ